MVDLRSIAGSIWRRTVPRPMRRALGAAVSDFLLDSVLKEAGADLGDLKPGPLIVSGFLNENSGIGRAGRLTVAGLSSAEFQPITHDIRCLVDSASFESELLNESHDGGVWILHCNPEEAIVAASRIKRSNWRHRYRIGYWAYELPCVPEQWLKLARLFHEIWVPSQFVADALSGIDRPVKVMPHFFEGPKTAARGFIRKKLGVDEGTFLVGAVGDALSSMTRKNLIGAFEAYVRAFPAADLRHTHLVVKLRNAQTDGENLKDLVASIESRADISLLQEEFSDEEMTQFVGDLDLFLSPHRSEGYGLVLTEAISLSVPVLATAWSGNMEYLSGVDDALIDFELEGVKDESGIYVSQVDTLWAAPDLDDAATKLQRLSTSPELCRAICSESETRLSANNTKWSPGNLAQAAWSTFITN